MIQRGVVEVLCLRDLLDFSALWNSFLSVFTENSGEFDEILLFYSPSFKQTSGEDRKAHLNR
jgi:hypothetical protein